MLSPDSSTKGFRVPHWLWLSFLSDNVLNDGTGTTLPFITGSAISPGGLTSKCAYEPSKIFILRDWNENKYLPRRLTVNFSAWNNFPAESKRMKLLWVNKREALPEGDNCQDIVEISRWCSSSAFHFFLPQGCL